MMPNVQATLQHEIELTSEKFQPFLVIIPEQVLHCSSKDIHWTNAEILYKISISPLMIHSVLIDKSFGVRTIGPLILALTGRNHCTNFI
jgi:hypothetical protein